MNEANLEKTDLSNADLTGATLVYTKLAKAILTNAVLLNTDLTQTNLTQAEGITQDTLNEAFYYYKPTAHHRYGGTPQLAGAKCADSGTQLTHDNMHTKP